MLDAAIDAAISNSAFQVPASEPVIAVTKGQAVIARLLAEGLSNRAIATHLGLSVGAADLAIHRLYKRIGVSKQGGIDARVITARMYLEGRLTCGREHLTAAIPS